MPNITNIQPPTAQRSGNQWRLSVTYTATFSAFEVANFNFRDTIQVWESDSTSRDDRLTGLRNGTNFNPASASVVRTKTTTVSGDVLDTELGGEEIFLRIRLFNIDLNTPPIIRDSTIINLAP